MCKYCEPESEESISEMDVDCGALGSFIVYTYIDHNRAFTTELYNGNKPVKKSVEINYCPMCGRELVEQE